MEFIKGEQYVINGGSKYSLYNEGDAVEFIKKYDDTYGQFERVNDRLSQTIKYEHLDLAECVEDTELIAKVNFKGFGEHRTRYKTYHFKTTISDLEKGEIVIVDSKGEFQCANFLGYLKEGEVHVSPTKYIISRFTTEAVRSKKVDRYTLESRGVKKVSEKTEILFMEIEAFHKKVLIDKCLDERNFEGLRELL